MFRMLFVNSSLSFFYSFKTITYTECRSDVWVCNIKFTNKSFSPHPKHKIPDLDALDLSNLPKPVVIFTFEFICVFHIPNTTNQNVHSQSHSFPQSSSKIHVSAKLGNVCVCVCECVHGISSREANTYTYLFVICMAFI